MEQPIKACILDFCFLLMDMIKLSSVYAIISPSRCATTIEMDRYPYVSLFWRWQQLFWLIESGYGTTGSEYPFSAMGRLFQQPVGAGKMIW